MASLVAVALAVALVIGVPHPAAIERAAAAAFGLLGLGAGSIALSAAVDSGALFGTKSSRRGEEPAEAAVASFVSLERSLRFGASTAGDFYTQVRPRLVALVSTCLAREGVALWTVQEQSSCSAPRPTVLSNLTALRPRTVSTRGYPSTSSAPFGQTGRAWRTPMNEPLATCDVARITNEVVDEVERAVIGKREAIELVLIGVLAGGHVLLEDVPDSRRP